MTSQNPKGLRIAFLHPDLGIGGAERLVVDAAMALQQYGHIVHMFTSHHEEEHCFEETKLNGPLRVIVSGDWLPRTFLNKFAIIFAMLRGIWLSLYLLCNWTNHNPLIKYGHNQYNSNKQLLGEYDIVITDQLSIYNFFLLFTTSRTIFYCHYPDLLLSKKESNPLLQLLKSLYRIPINHMEMITTGMADTILVNSKFTASTFAKTFPQLHTNGIQPKVLYPSILMSSYDNNRVYDEKVMKWWEWRKLQKMNNDTSSNEPKIVEYDPKDDFAGIENIPRDICVFVSINRFEIKKAIEQTLYGFYELKKYISQREQKKDNKIKNELLLNNNHIPFTNAKLIIAGGYDKLVPENVEYHLHLTKTAYELNLTTSIYPDIRGDIIFLLSFTQTQRTSLLRRAQSILYTPQNEHFGIVPIEAMYSSRSVIAHFSGGPLESIKHGVTGFLCNHYDHSDIEVAAEILPNVLEQIEKASEDGTIIIDDNLTTNTFRPTRTVTTTTPKPTQKSTQTTTTTTTSNFPLINELFTFGKAMIEIYSNKNNKLLCINNHSNQHSIENFSIQVFSKTWNDTVLETNQIPIHKSHWFKSFASHFGTNPMVRMFLLTNMALSVIFVTLYSISKSSLFR